jgi:hypothetical protein
MPSTDGKWRGPPLSRKRSRCMPTTSWIFSLEAALWRANIRISQVVFLRWGLNHVVVGRREQPDI